MRNAPRAPGGTLYVPPAHPEEIRSGGHPPNPPAATVAAPRWRSRPGRLFGIEVLDHIVIGRGGFVSLKDQGVIRDG